MRGLPASLESVPRSPFEDVTPGKVVGWMLARPGKLRPEVEAQLDQITQIDGTLAQARALTQGFLDLIRHHNSEVRIVDEIRRHLKICFAAPYAQYQTRKSRIQKIGFAAMSKTEGISRRDTTRSRHTSKLEMQAGYGSVCHQMGY